MVVLREYQQEALRAITGAWRQGTTRQLVCLPTGCGKTIVFAALARELNVRTLIVAHREELINQAVDKIRLVWPDAGIGVCMADRDEAGRQVVVASVQTASRPRRLARLREQGFRLLVIDEAHHATAETYRRVAEDLNFMSGGPDRLLVGVTATGKRGDKTALGGVFQEIVFERSMATMIKAGYLSDLRGIRVATRTSLAGVRVRGGDFAERDLAAAVNTGERNRIIVDAYRKKAAGRKAVAFTASVEHALDLAAEFQSAGIKAAAVYGDMPRDERRSALEAFSGGKLRVLTNCNLLTEGYDRPDLGALLMARPTKSDVLYTQMVGRGTRKWPGKTDCLVLDFTDSRHDVCSLGTLAGAAVKTGQTFTEAVAEREAQERGAGVAARAGEVVTAAFDLVQRSRFRWTPLAEGHFRLSLGDGAAVYLKNTGGKYRVGLVQDGKLVRHLSDADLPLGYAQGVAEDWCRKSGTAVLVDKAAGWRRTPATPKQLETLRKFGCKPERSLTRGEAADLLDQAIAAAEARKHEPATAKQVYALRRLGFNVKQGLTKGEAKALFGQAKAAAR